MDEPVSQSLIRSANHSLDAPCRNVKAQAGLNRVIPNTGWSAMEQTFSCKSVELVRSASGPQITNPQRMRRDRCRLAARADKLHVRGL